MKAFMRARRAQFMCHMRSAGQGQAVYCSDVLPKSWTSLHSRTWGEIWGWVGGVVQLPQHPWNRLGEKFSVSDFRSFYL